MMRSLLLPWPLDEALRYWRGEGPLWRLYWIYGVLVSTLGGALILTSVQYRLVSPWLVLILVLLGLIYTLWVLVSVWRSAFNMGPAPHDISRDTLGWMARLLTFGWALNAVGASMMLLQAAFGYVP